MQRLYPPARRRIIPPGANDPDIIVVGVILHVAATRARSLFNFFSRLSGGIESHLYLRRRGRKPWDQYRTFDHEADAQYKGNSWIGPDGRRYGFISVETAGLGGGKWSRRQIEELKTFLAWASKEFGFPLRVVPTTQPNSPAEGGVGYHTMRPGWSNVAGKTCPGPRRKKQFVKIFIPWMRRMSQPCKHCVHHCPKKEADR